MSKKQTIARAKDSVASKDRTFARTAANYLFKSDNTASTSDLFDAIQKAGRDARETTVKRTARRRSAPAA